MLYSYKPSFKMSLEASVKGRFKVCEKTLDRNIVINGYMNNPLRPKVYLNELDFVNLKFEKYTNIMTIVWSSQGKPKFDVKDNYLRSLASMYVATVKCGVSQSMLAVGGLIAGCLKYHVALTFQLMYTNPELLLRQLDKVDVEIILNNIPTRKAIWNELEIKTNKDPGKWIMSNVHVSEWGKYKAMIDYESDSDDYEKMIQRESPGITEYGVTGITDSVLTLVYCVLLAQGKTKNSIVGKDGLSKLTCLEFIKLHNVRVASGDITQNIRNTKAAMGLNTAVGNISSLVDITKGIVRVPGNIVQYKLLGSVIAPVKEVSKVRTRELDVVEELVESDTEGSEPEDSEGSDSDDEGDVETVNGSLKGGLIIGGILTTAYSIKRRWQRKGN